MQKTEKRRLVVVFSIGLLFIISFISIPNPISASDSSLSLEIDVFTKKSPNTGLGQNEPAGSYTPLETVELTANVSYNQNSVEGFPVSFQIDGPVTSEVTQFYRTVFTNQTGQATISFMIPPHNSSNQAVGTWTAYALVQIGEEIVIDTLTFEVESELQLDSESIGSSLRELFILLLVTIATLLGTLLILILRKKTKKQVVIQKTSFAKSTPVPTSSTEANTQINMKPTKHLLL